MRNTRGDLQTCRKATGIARSTEALAEVSRGDALAEVTALFAHIVGLLMLSHTGRIRMFKQASQELFDRYLDRLVAMVAEPEKASRSKRGRN